MRYIKYLYIFGRWIFPTEGSSSFVATNENYKCLAHLCQDDMSKLKVTFSIRYHASQALLIRKRQKDKDKINF